MQGVTLCGKKNPGNKQENTTFFDPKDPEGGIQISFDIPDAMIKPGYPLRELGLGTDAVGRIGGVRLTEEGWEYITCFGKDYGGPRKNVRTEKLDELFHPILPIKAVQVDLKKYLVEEHDEQK